MRCDICSKNFGSDGALEVHRFKEHPDSLSKKRLRNPGASMLIFLIIIVVSIIGFVSYSSGGDQERYDLFSKCINESGAKMYGAFWCSACIQQKKILRESESMPYVECSSPDGNSQLSECVSENIQSYPTWVFGDGTREVGIQTITKLGQKTGCVF